MCFKESLVKYAIAKGDIESLDYWLEIEWLWMCDVTKYILKAPSPVMEWLKSRVPKLDMLYPWLQALAANDKAGMEWLELHKIPVPLEDDDLMLEAATLGGPESLEFYQRALVK